MTDGIAPVRRLKEVPVIEKVVLYHVVDQFHVGVLLVGYEAVDQAALEVELVEALLGVLDLGHILHDDKVHWRRVGYLEAEDAVDTGN